MNDQNATDLIHWVRQLVIATIEATSSAERRHQELMAQREDHFSRDQYTQGYIASQGEK